MWDEDWAEIVVEKDDEIKRLKKKVKKLNAVYKKAKELGDRLDEGECDSDDLINFVVALARKEDV